MEYPWRTQSGNGLINVYTKKNYHYQINGVVSASGEKNKVRISKFRQHFYSINCRLVMWEITYISIPIVKNKNCILFWCNVTSRALQVFCLYTKNLRFIDFVNALQPTYLLIHWTFSSWKNKTLSALSLDSEHKCIWKSQIAYHPYIFNDQPDLSGVQKFSISFRNLHQWTKQDTLKGFSYDAQ